MKQVFADSMYWIALTSVHDQWHSHAVKASRTLRGVLVVTTEDVFDEFLAYFSERGTTLRDVAARTVEDSFTDPSILVKPQSHQSFLDGLTLFSSAPR